MVLIRLWISKIFRLLSKFLRTITIGITVTIMFHCFLSSLTRSKYFSLFSLSLFFTQLVRYKENSFFFFFSFLLLITRTDLQHGIRWSLCIPKSQWILCISFSRTDAGLCIYHLVVWSNFSFLQDSHWITFHTQLCHISFALICSIRIL